MVVACGHLDYNVPIGVLAVVVQCSRGRIEQGAAGVLWASLGPAMGAGIGRASADGMPAVH